MKVKSEIGNSVKVSVGIAFHDGFKTGGRIQLALTLTLTLPYA
jgi:hypothetical protein